VPRRLFPRMGLPPVLAATRTPSLAPHPIPLSCLALFASTLAWATMMLLLGFSPETTVAVLSAATVAVSRLAGLTVHGPLDSTAISNLTRRPR
jgi:hypothetical protein